MIYFQLIELKEKFEQKNERKPVVLAVDPDMYERIKAEINELGKRQYTEVVKDRVSFFGIPIISSKEVDSATFF